MKTILVSGGSRGIGKETVKDLTRKGHKVFFTYRYSKEQSEKIIEELNSEGYQNVEAFQCDMGSESDVKQLFKNNKEVLQTIDILINNAGARDKKSKLFLMTSSNEWRELMHNNVNIVINATRAVLPSMIKQRSGKILNITSLSGIIGTTGQTAYSSSKAAIACFSKALAKEVSKFGIIINCLAPGFVETEMTEDLSEKYLEGKFKNGLIKRIGTAEEIANMISYLAVDAPDFFINQEVVIDGGLVN